MLLRISSLLVTISISTTTLISVKVTFKGSNARQVIFKNTTWMIISLPDKFYFLKKIHKWKKRQLTNFCILNIKYNELWKQCINFIFKCPQILTSVSKQNSVLFSHKSEFFNCKCFYIYRYEFSSTVRNKAKTNFSFNTELSKYNNN